MRSALVTGGAGFIGSHLVDGLLHHGWRVRVLDNFTTGCWENLASKQIEVVEGDVRDAAALERACEGVDAVFHMAAIASVPSSIADPWTAHAVNAGGCLNALGAARNQRVRRFIFSSSAAVYGSTEQIPVDEEQPLRPQSPYASQKALCEFYCRNFSELFGLETVCLRYFNVFGPRQSRTSGYAAAIPLFVQAALDGRAPIVYGDGQQTRDFVYVSDVVNANLRAAEADTAAGRVINIGGGVEISILGLLSELERAIGERLEPSFRAPRAGEVRHSVASIHRARELLQYEPGVSFQSGLRQTIAAASARAAGIAPGVLAAA